MPSITCKHVGKLSTKPQPLLVVFNDAHNRDRILLNTKLLNLPMSAIIKNNVYTSHDLTELERKEKFMLRQEQHVQKAVDKDVVISNGKAIPHIALPKM